MINSFAETSPEAISLMQETLLALRALVSFLLRHWGDVSRVVTKVLVPLQHMLLLKALVALIALKWFLVCVYQHMRLEAAMDG